MNIAKFKIVKPYKSIAIPLEFELPSFSVLTGQNGTGKTHLFEAISTKNVGQVFYKGKPLDTIRYIPFNNLNPQVDTECDVNIISKRVKTVWNGIRQAHDIVASNGLKNPKIDKPEDDFIYQKIQDNSVRDTVLGISKRSQILPSQLTEDSIRDNINMADLSGGNPFNSQFALIFKTYHIRYIDNKLNRIYRDSGMKEPMPFLNDEDFKKKYGDPPWEFVNSVLERLRLPYQVNNPMGTFRETTFMFKLLHRDLGFEINTNDLSTGEKTMMSLALAVYNSTGQVDRAEMLVLDEPDAPLHPSMSKLLLDILEKDISENSGIPVLMSTHLPTTIACAPPYALHRITRENKTPNKCSLEDSIESLSYGIPNLRVSTESRRQVFVEDEHDVDYYETIFNILDRKIHFTTKPQFLPPHKHGGTNCTDVIDIARVLDGMGNDRVYGLVDWDLVNKPEKNVVVLGYNNRYAIENYLFEPHIAGLYLIRKNIVNPAEIGLGECNSYVETIKCIEDTPEKLQSITNEVEDKLFGHKDNAEKVASYLLGGNTLMVRKEVFSIRGHDLETKYIEVWPKLNGVKRGGGDSIIKIDIINTIINDMPMLLSRDVADAFLQFK